MDRESITLELMSPKTPIDRIRQILVWSCRTNQLDAFITALVINRRNDIIDWLKAWMPDLNGEPYTSEKFLEDTNIVAIAISHGIADILEFVCIQFDYDPKTMKYKNLEELFEYEWDSKPNILKWYIRNGWVPKHPEDDFIDAIVQWNDIELAIAAIPAGPWHIVCNSALKYMRVNILNYLMDNHFASLEYTVDTYTDTTETDIVKPEFWEKFIQKSSAGVIKSAMTRSNSLLFNAVFECDNRHLWELIADKTSMPLRECFIQILINPYLSHGLFRPKNHQRPRINTIELMLQSDVAIPFDKIYDAYDCCAIYKIPDFLKILDYYTESNVEHLIKNCHHPAIVEYFEKRKSRGTRTKAASCIFTSENTKTACSFELSRVIE